MKPENFQLLKAGLVNRISVHTNTMAQFLEGNKDIGISHFVLLEAENHGFNDVIMLPLSLNMECKKPL